MFGLESGIPKDIGLAIGVAELGEAKAIDLKKVELLFFDLLMSKGHSTAINIISLGQ